MITKGEIAYGDIVWTEFNPSIGHEYQGKRPAVVVQSNAQLRKSSLVTIIPLTSNLSNVVRDDITVVANQENKLLTDSVAKVHCVTSFDYTRFSKKIGKLDEKTSSVLKGYLKKHFGL